MILFFDFERLLHGQAIGDIGPAARLAKVLMPYQQVDLVLTRWRIGAMRSIKDVRGEVPELGDRINDVAHRPVRSDEQPEREITGTLRRTRQLYWAAVVPDGDAQGYIEQFEAETQWHPDKVAMFGGALLYTQYGFIKRRIMRKIAEEKPGALGTDTSHDYVYTEWDAVTRFAEHFADQLESTPA